MNILRKKAHPLIQELRIVVVQGQVDSLTLQSIREADCQDVVEVTGYLPHHESVAWLQSADALFLPLHGLPQGNRSLIVPGKLYEYLAVGKPILACLPEGDAKELVLRSGLGYTADPCDAQSIGASLIRLYEDVLGIPREPARLVAARL